jgi:hypothetical protein
VYIATILCFFLWGVMGIVIGGLEKAKQKDKENNVDGRHREPEEGGRKLEVATAKVSNLRIAATKTALCVGDFYTMFLQSFW